jgi:hypothetical protein
VAAAEKAAAQGDGPTVLWYLKAAGEWTLRTVAAEAVKRAMAGPA